MDIDHYCRLVDLGSATEIQKVVLLAFYFEFDKDDPEFSPSEMAEILVGLGYARPNLSRMAGRIRRSRDFIKGSTSGFYRLSLDTRGMLEAKFPSFGDTDEIVSDSVLIPEILFEGLRRPYLLRTVKQINASYEANLFDATALMMRRLLEILLIHTFQAVGLESEVHESNGGFQALKTLVNKAVSRSEVGLSPNVKKSIDQFRELGNLSAHLLHYNCRKDDIRPLRMEYRAVIEELLYKCDFARRHDADS